MKTGKTKHMRVKNYNREQPYILYTYTCQICGTQNTIEILPGGFKPRYCPAPPGASYSDCKRESKRRMMARKRAKG